MPAHKPKPKTAKKFGAGVKPIAAQIAEPKGAPPVPFTAADVMQARQSERQSIIDSIIRRKNDHIEDADNDWFFRRGPHNIRADECARIIHSLTKL